MMGRVEKTVFISYRRADESWGLAVFENLTKHGYDVFIDYDGIASGNFEAAILENIKARAHFLVLLTPTALERCSDPKDWMRREIEAALDSQRNIVPLMLAGFDFGISAAASQLTGKLAALKKYNGLPIPQGYFSSAMERLRNKFLNVPVDAVLHPVSDSAQQVAKEQKDKATTMLGKALLGASNMSVPLVGAEVRSSVALGPELRTAREILLNLENVRGLSDATVDVYIDVPKRSDPAKHPDHFAGTLALLGLREATLVKDKCAGDGLTFCLEITRVIDTLYRAGALDRQLLVRLVPLKPVPEAACVNIGRISIYGATPAPWERPRG
jgi:TIR domain